MKYNGKNNVIHEHAKFHMRSQGPSKYVVGFVLFTTIQLCIALPCAFCQFFINIIPYGITSAPECKMSKLLENVEVEVIMDDGRRI